MNRRDEAGEPASSLTKARDMRGPLFHPAELAPRLITLTGHTAQLGKELRIARAEVEACLALHAFLQCRRHTFDRARIDRHEMVADVGLAGPNRREHDRLLIFAQRMRVEVIIAGLVVHHLQLWSVVRQNRPEVSEDRLELGSVRHETLLRMRREPKLPTGR